MPNGGPAPAGYRPSSVFFFSSVRSAMTGAGLWGLTATRKRDIGTDSACTTEVGLPYSSVSGERLIKRTDCLYCLSRGLGQHCSRATHACRSRSSLQFPRAFALQSLVLPLHRLPRSADPWTMRKLTVLFSIGTFWCMAREASTAEKPIMRNTSRCRSKRTKRRDTLPPAPRMETASNDAIASIWSTARLVVM